MKKGSEKLIGVRNGRNESKGEKRELLLKTEVKTLKDDGRIKQINMNKKIQET